MLYDDKVFGIIQLFEAGVVVESFSRWVLPSARRWHLRLTFNTQLDLYSAN
jgi:hypothetical protein